MTILLFLLTTLLHAGAPLAIGKRRVHNDLIHNIGVIHHAYGPETQSRWNGIVGRIRLRATDRVWIDDVQVYPDAAARVAKVSVVIRNPPGGGGRGTLTVAARSDDVANRQAPDAPGGPVPVRCG